MTSALLTPAAAARLAGVTVQTLVRWDHAGRVDTVRTPGGHRRYHDYQIRAIVSPDSDDVAARLRAVELEFPGIAVRLTPEGQAVATWAGRIPKYVIYAHPTEIRDAVIAQIAEWSNQ